MKLLQRDGRWPRNLHQADRHHLSSGWMRSWEKIFFVFFRKYKIIRLRLHRRWSQLKQQLATGLVVTIEGTIMSTFLFSAENSPVKPTDEFIINVHVIHRGSHRYGISSFVGIQASQHLTPLHLNVILFLGILNSYRITRI